MGFMTEISFLNDNWPEIKKSIRKDPDRFVQAIDTLMNGNPIYSDIDGTYQGKEFPGEARLGVNARFKMYPSHHADEPRLYLAFQNMFLSLGRYDIEREYKGRLDNKGDHMLEVLDRFVGMAEGILHSTANLIREKYEDREAGVGS